MLQRRGSNQIDRDPAYELHEEIEHRLGDHTSNPSRG